MIINRRTFLPSITLAFVGSIELWARFISPAVFGVDFYGVWAPIDSVMHFFWGVSLFLLALLFFNLRAASVCAGLLIAHMFWEVCEMIGDILIPNQVHMTDNFFYDGIEDTLFFFAGAMLGWLLFQYFIVERRGTYKFAKLVSSLILALLPVCQAAFQMFVIQHAGPPRQYLVAFLLCSMGLISLLMLVLGKTRVATADVQHLRESWIRPLGGIYALLLVPLIVIGSVLYRATGESPNLLAIIWISVSLVGAWLAWRAALDVRRKRLHARACAHRKAA